MTLFPQNADRPFFLPSRHSRCPSRPGRGRGQREAHRPSARRQHARPLIVTTGPTSTSTPTSSLSNALARQNAPKTWASEPDWPRAGPLHERTKRWTALLRPRGSSRTAEKGGRRFYVAPPSKRPARPAGTSRRAQPVTTLSRASLRARLPATVRVPAQPFPRRTATSSPTRSQDRPPTPRRSLRSRLQTVPFQFRELTTARLSPRAGGAHPPVDFESGACAMLTGVELRDNPK